MRQIGCWIGLCGLFLGLSSCMTPTAEKDRAGQDPMTAIGGAARRAWKELTPEHYVPAKPWAWTTAIPGVVPRAELLRPALSKELLVALVPDFKEPDIVNASVQPVEPLSISAVDEVATTNCGQLHAALEHALLKKKPARVTWKTSTGRDAGTTELQLDKLVVVAHAACPESLCRVTEDGNPWIVLKQDGIRCKVMARVERERGLVQVVMSLGICWGPSMLLPREVMASCNGTPLRCLTVTETLDALYNDEAVKAIAGVMNTSSFAAVSEREDYLMPTNYRSLEEKTTAAERRHVGPTRQPAFLPTPGVAYPGPAVLGDARALCAFLAQRQYYQPAQPERVSWIVFADPCVCKGRDLEIRLDLGGAPQTLTFKLPER